MFLTKFNYNKKKLFSQLNCIYSQLCEEKNIL